ncbi:unnamed protein product [Anisakis simplex]|uniref:Serine/arginine repetitive matrix protein 1 n=1 Tax=Anisakis simplex TaxID=6269 RepID=A0A0M3K5X2_ANISI|nr:unnamed protein product [Anisakis simplex]
MPDKYAPDQQSPVEVSDLTEPKSFYSETELAEAIDPFREWHPYFMKNLYNPKWRWIDDIFNWIQIHFYVRREQVKRHMQQPSRNCFQALGKKRRVGIPGEREHWLAYWTVFSFFTLQDYYSGWLTANFPPFYLLKMLFLVLLALPTSGVSEKCYYRFVCPLLSKLDDTFNKYNVEIIIIGALCGGILLVTAFIILFLTRPSYEPEPLESIVEVRSVPPRSRRQKAERSHPKKRESSEKKSDKSEEIRMDKTQWDAEEEVGLLAKKKVPSEEVIKTARSRQVPAAQVISEPLTTPADEKTPPARARVIRAKTVHGGSVDSQLIKEPSKDRFVTEVKLVKSKTKEEDAGTGKETEKSSAEGSSKEESEETSSKAASSKTDSKAAPSKTKPSSGTTDDASSSSSSSSTQERSATTDTKQSTATSSTLSANSHEYQTVRTSSESGNWGWVQSPGNAANNNSPQVPLWMNAKDGAPPPNYSPSPAFAPLPPPPSSPNPDILASQQPTPQFAPLVPVIPPPKADLPIPSSGPTEPDQTKPQKQSSSSSSKEKESSSDVRKLQ